MLSPKELHSLLRREVPELLKENGMGPNRNIGKKEMTLLIYYLALEEPGTVSITKFFRALNLTSRDPPLQQDQIDQLK